MVHTSVCGLRGACYGDHRVMAWNHFSIVCLHTCSCLEAISSLVQIFLCTQKHYLSKNLSFSLLFLKRNFNLLNDLGLQFNMVSLRKDGILVLSSQTFS